MAIAIFHNPVAIAKQRLAKMLNEPKTLQLSNYQHPS